MSDADTGESTVRLFQNSNNILNPIQDSSFKLEKHIQSLVESNMEALFGLEFVSSEFSLGKFRLDSLAFDKQNNSFVIIEYKKGRDFGVTDQGHSYLRAVMNNQADCTLEYRDKTGKKLKKSNVDWQSSRVIFIAPSFTIYQKNSVGDDVPFELWEIKKFDDELIAIEKYGSSFNESIKRPPEKPPLPEDPKGLSEIEELEHVKKLGESLKPIWATLKEKLKDYPDTSLPPKKNYISWEKGKKAICHICFQSQKKRLKIEVHRGTIKTDGKKSKGFFTLNDPKKFAKDAPSGKTMRVYWIYLKKQEDLDYVMSLLEQKYNSLN